MTRPFIVQPGQGRVLVGQAMLLVWQRARLHDQDSLLLSSATRSS